MGRQGFASGSQSRYSFRMHPAGELSISRLAPSGALALGLLLRPAR
jgi:hypothetical protein